MSHGLTIGRRIAAAALALGAMQAQAAGIQVEHAWARATVAGQPAGGAFLTLKNEGAANDRLLGASSAVAERVELHMMRLDGDVMRMREVDAIDLPAGQSVALVPGKLHLMLMGLRAPLQPGSRFPLTLKLEKAGELTVQVQVESMMPPGHDIKD